MTTSRKTPADLAKALGPDVRTLDPARARQQDMAREAAELASLDAPLDVAPLTPAGPGKEIGEILFELVRAGVAWSMGKPDLCRRWMKRAADRLALVRVQIDHARVSEKLPR